MTGPRETVLLVFIVQLFGLSIKGGESVEIKTLRVPERVVNGSMPSVVLDCDYSLEEPSGLVVKWFFNDHPDPVYQWIHRKKPQDLGVLKGRLNLGYRASDDDTKAHRALEILNPTTALSGEYTCLVSTFFGEASMSKKMVVYVPERSLTLTKLKKDTSVTVRCVAEGVYPEPKLSIFAKNSLSQIQPEVEVVSKQNVYDIMATVTYNDKELETPTTFECNLRIPEANYTVSKSTLYYPVTEVTTRLPPKYFPSVKQIATVESNSGSCLWLHPLLPVLTASLYLLQP